MPQSDLSLIRHSSLQVVLAGATAGGLISFLFLTPSGRRACSALAQALDAFSFEWTRLSHALGRAQVAAADGWKALEGADVSGSRR